MEETPKTEEDNLSPKDRIYFQRILHDSILVTDEIYGRYKDWITRCITDDEFKRAYNEVLVDSELGARTMRQYARICWPKIYPGKPKSI